jgi:hypothetical protein
MGNLFSLAAFVILFRIAAERYGSAAAVWAILLLMLFPGSLFFQFIYTESLFLLLLMLLCLALEWENHSLALVSAFLLPLTKAIGVFCVFPLLWHLFFTSPPSWWRSLANRQGLAGRSARFIGARGCNSSELNTPGWSRASAAWLVLMPIIGWCAYLLLMQKWTGNAFEGFEAQKLFGGTQSIDHFFQPTGFVIQLFHPTGWHGYKGSLLDRCVFILLIYCFPLIWKLDKSWCIWAFFLGVVPAVSGGFTSFTRFAAVIFPVFIALGVFLSKPGLRWLRWFTLTIFVVLHLILVWRFVNFEWAG